MKKKNQPAVIEVERTEGDNQISFAVRGSAQWLQEMMPFVMFNLGTLTNRIWECADEVQRADLLAGINALQAHASYQGEFITVRIAQEKPL